MSKPVPRDPRCECCARRQTEVEGVIIIHRGGIKPRLCFHCIDELKTLADEARAEPVAEAAD